MPLAWQERSLPRFVPELQRKKFFMITNEELSLTQQTKGRKILLSFSFLNGIALTFITGNVLSLYLLKVGCTTPVVAFIASFGYLGTLFAFTGKTAISKFGAGLTLRLAWILCGFTAIAMALIPFLQYLELNKDLLVTLITCVTFLFFAFKSIGTASTQPLMGEFTDKENQGEFSSKYFLYYTLANIIAMGCVIGFISWHRTLIIFQLVILLGGLIKLACSCLFIGLNETEVPRESARSVTTKKLLATIWNVKEYRSFLFCRSFSRAGLILIVPISILALKQLYNVTDLTALIFAFVQLAGGIAITYLNGIISDETGPKPLLLLYVILLFVISLLWIFAPNDFSWWFTFIIFFVGGICLCGLDSCLNYYYLTIIPRENSVGISLWYTVISGAVAGILGLLLGGGLLQAITMLVAQGQIFRYYYCIMFILMLPVLYIVYKLKSPSSWRLRDVLKLSIEPHEMHTVYVMHRLQKYSSADDEYNSVAKLESMKSDLSQDSLIYYLESPKYRVRIRALRALYGTHLKQATIVRIIKELQFGEYTTGYLAAHLLGDRRVKEGIPLMRKYLSSKDHHLAAICMLALVKLEDKESYPRIIQIYKDSIIPLKLVYGTNAITSMKDINMLKVLLDKYVEVTARTDKIISRYNKDCTNCTEHKDFAHTMFKKRDAVTCEIISCIAEIAGIGDTFYEFLRIYDNHHETGILNLCENMIEINQNTELDSPQKILHNFTKGKIKKIEVIEYLKKSAKGIENPIELIMSNFLAKTNSGSVRNALIYCIFLILFSNKKKKK